MTLPNFLIVGAAKSGTTSLYQYLDQHPEVCMASDKEPSHFVDWAGGVTDFCEYEALFDGCSGEKAVGEASTAYLYEDAAPARIKDTLGNVKIIIMLRNPVDMCFSLWRHMSRLGERGERLTFEKAIDAEPARIADRGGEQKSVKSWHANFYYVSRAMYYAQVKRYLDSFGRDRVLILLFEEFARDPLEETRRVFRFLDVDENFAPDIKRHNVGWNVRHRGLHKLINHPTEFQAKLGSLIPGALRNRLKRVLNGMNSKHSPMMEAALRRRLTETFRSDVNKLSELIGRDLSVWY